MVSPLGLEPRTIPLKALCITQQPLFNGNSEYVNVRFLELRTPYGRLMNYLVHNDKVLRRMLESTGKNLGLVKS